MQIWSFFVYLRIKMCTLNGCRRTVSKSAPVVFLWSNLIFHGSSIVCSGGAARVRSTICRLTSVHPEIGLLNLNPYSEMACNIIDLFQLLIDEIEVANTDRIAELSKVYKLKDKTKLIFKYHERIGQSHKEAFRSIDHFDVDTIPYKTLVSMMITHYDLRFPDIYKFRPRYLTNRLGIEESICANF